MVPFGLLAGACCDTPEVPTLLGLLGTGAAPGCVTAPDAEPETPGVEAGAAFILPAPLLLPIASPLTTISTRRFIWRPAAVRLEATGLSGPKPRSVTLLEGTPWLTRKLRTAAARRSDNVMLNSCEPVLSV